MHNFLGINNKMNNFRKGTFLDAFDEPTYLTFALDFKFENAVIEGSSDVDESRLWGSPLFEYDQNNASADTAANFLNNRGYSAQANGLLTFKELFRYLTFSAPWYFQSIRGLDSLFEKSTDQTDGYKAKEATLTIETLEAIDLRMTEIAALYRNAIFDSKYRRNRVPDNLRWFSVDIYVAEFRNMRFRLPGQSQQAAQAVGVNTSSLGGIVGGGNVISNVMDQFGYVKFECRQCEFDFSESVPFANTINIDGENRRQESNKFKINVGWFKEEYKFSDGTTIYDDPSKTQVNNPWSNKGSVSNLQNAGSFLSGLPGIGDNLANAGAKAKQGLSSISGTLGINKALESAASFFNPSVADLGDIYGTGYESNGDTVPRRGTPPDQNIYG